MSDTFGTLLKYASQVAELTNCNDHTGAIRKIAEYAVKKHNTLGGCGSMLKDIDAVSQLHKRYGYMTKELNALRNDIKGQAFSLLSTNEEAHFNAAL